MGMFSVLCLFLLSESDVLKSVLVFAWRWCSHFLSAFPIDILEWL